MKYDKLLSSFVFNRNLCPYTAVLVQLNAENQAALAAADADAELRRRNESAVVIQSAARGLMKRRAYARITAASRLINRVGRGHMAGAYTRSLLSST
jgi:hypothetical protein